MKVYLGVTDIRWYEQLRVRATPAEEVNFWFPSPATGFQAVPPGGLFLFKTHVDHRNPAVSDRVVGVGMFAGFARLQLGEAWELFGEGNGVNGIDELRTRIEHYRRTPIGHFENPLIGCVVLNEVLFFSPESAPPAPDDFAKNIVRGRGYETDDLPTDHPVAEAVARYFSSGRQQLLEEAGWILPGTTHGEPRMIIPRVGQQSFKAVISEHYAHRCALTGNRVRPVMEAAHIKPVSAGGEHRGDNGILLRSDMHTLFDRGYIGFDAKFRLRVSPALREQYGNGDWLYARQGSQIAVPDRRADRPRAEFLEWHNENVFLADNGS